MTELDAAHEMRVRRFFAEAAARDAERVRQVELAYPVLSYDQLKRRLREEEVPPSDEWAPFCRRCYQTPCICRGE
jgi:hypothetical protein